MHDWNFLYLPLRLLQACGCSLFWWHNGLWRGSFIQVECYMTQMSSPRVTSPLGVKIKRNRAISDQLFRKPKKNLITTLPAAKAAGGMGFPIVYLSRNLRGSPCAQCTLVKHFTVNILYRVTIRTDVFNCRQLLQHKYNMPFSSSAIIASITSLPLSSVFLFL